MMRTMIIGATCLLYQIFLGVAAHQNDGEHHLRDARTAQLAAELRYRTRRRA